MNQSKLSLVVVTPVYNEKKAISEVIENWIFTLSTLKISFEFLVLDGGSTDGTLEELAALQKKDSRIKVLVEAKMGHGRACMRGYELALRSQPEWILQIDSDGQCDPKYFSKFWEEKEKYDCVLGDRVHRKDGFHRRLMSRVVSLIFLVKHGVWLRDSNVPYRLYRYQTLYHLIPKINPMTRMPHVGLTLLLKKNYNILFVPICFEQRVAGKSALRLKTVFSIANELLHDDRLLAEAA